MPKNIVLLSVFISCPTDLNALRGVAEVAIKEVSETLQVVKGIQLVPISWKKDLVPGVSSDAQQVINEQTIGRYDIYLGFLGARFGTETTHAGSGTEEEFDLAFGAYSNDPSSIKMLFYLQAFGVNPFAVDPDQLAKVKAFQAKLKQKGVFYQELENIDDALSSLKSHLLKTVTDDWSAEDQKWKTPHLNKTLAVTPISLPADFSENVGKALAVGEIQESDDLGILELDLAVKEEFDFLITSMQTITTNINLLTEQTNRLSTRGLDPQLGVNTLRVNVEDYAEEVKTFVHKCTPELASMRFHGNKGAQTIEQYFSILHKSSLANEPSIKGVVDAVEGVEPSLRGFRDSVVASKQGILSIPPLTRKLKSGLRAMIQYQDDLVVELTLLLERLGLLRTRLIAYLPNRSVL